MLAFVLFVLLAPKLALVELLVELLIGLAVLAGGGRKRVALVLRRSRLSQSRREKRFSPSPRVRKSRHAKPF